MTILEETIQYRDQDSSACWVSYEEWREGGREGEGEGKGGREGEGEGKGGRDRVGVRERESEWSARETRRSFIFSKAIHLI